MRGVYRHLGDKKVGIIHFDRHLETQAHCSRGSGLWAGGGGLEVVEVSPPYDISDITALMVTRVIYEPEIGQRYTCPPRGSPMEEIRSGRELKIDRQD